MRRSFRGTRLQTATPTALAATTPDDDDEAAGVYFRFHDADAQRCRGLQVHDGRHADARRNAILLRRGRRVPSRARLPCRHDIQTPVGFFGLLQVNGEGLQVGLQVPKGLLVMDSDNGTRHESRTTRQQFVVMLQWFARDGYRPRMGLCRSPSIAPCVSPQTVEMLLHCTRCTPPPRHQKYPVTASGQEGGL